MAHGKVSVKFSLDVTERVGKVRGMKKLICIFGFVLAAMLVTACNGHEPCSCACNKQPTVENRVPTWALRFCAADECLALLRPEYSKQVITHRLTHDNITNYYCRLHAPPYDAVRAFDPEDTEYLVGPELRRVNKDGSPYNERRCAICNSKHICEPTVTFITNSCRSIYIPSGLTK